MSRKNVIKLSTEEKTTEFIRKAIIVHGDKYDYSKVVYINTRTKVIIICKVHNHEFLVTPHNHLLGTNCPICGEINRKINVSRTYGEIIDLSNKIHNNAYLYKEVDDYNVKMTSYEKIEIYCPKCNKWFIQNVNSHISKHGCPHCHNIQNYKYHHIKTYNDVIEYSKKLYNNKYIYNTQVDLNKKILKSDKISYWCPDCNKIFTQKIIHHIDGHCHCYCARRTKKKIITTIKVPKQYGTPYKDIINLANKIHDNKYQYDNSILPDTFIKNKDILNIYCPKCKEWFKQQKVVHINMKGGCPICKSSRGELVINNYLKDKNIDFITQKKFPDCKLIRVLKFDFYLPDYNMCIEFDGIQHFEVSDFSKDIDRNIKNFLLTQKRDAIKTQYCKDKNIKLIRISYKQFSKIENILDSILQVC